MFGKSHPDTFFVDDFAQLKERKSDISKIEVHHDDKNIIGYEVFYTDFQVGHHIGKELSPGMKCDTV